MPIATPIASPSVAMPANAAIRGTETTADDPHALHAIAAGGVVSEVASLDADDAPHDSDLPAGVAQTVHPILVDVPPRPRAVVPYFELHSIFA